VSNAPAEIRIRVRVTPRGGRDGIDGVADGLLRIRVAAAPADGAANDATVRLLAATLGTAPTNIRVLSGHAARLKLIGIRGPTRADLIARWPDLGV
jgi:uncharacterized protein